MPLSWRLGNCGGQTCDFVDQSFLSAISLLAFRDRRRRLPSWPPLRHPGHRQPCGRSRSQCPWKLMLQPSSIQVASQRQASSQCLTRGLERRQRRTGLSCPGKSTGVIESLPGNSGWRRSWTTPSLRPKRVSAETSRQGPRSSSSSAQDTTSPTPYIAASLLPLSSVLDIPLSKPYKFKSSRESRICNLLSSNLLGGQVYGSG